MALDRSKFKPTVISTAVERDKELASALGRDGGSWTKYYKFEDGDQLLRIYPPHPEDMGGGNVFAEPKVTVWLPMMVPVRDIEGKEIIENGVVKTKEGGKSVFNSRIHGNTEKDLVEEYVRIAVQRLEEDVKSCQDPEESEKIKNKLAHIRGNFKAKIQGIKYQQKWVMYADRIVGNVSNFWIVEIGPAIKDRLNSIASSTDEANSPLATDPFTDIEEGRAIKITYNSKATKASDYYKVELDNVTVKTEISGRTISLPRTYPLSNEQLEAFMKITPLAKRFKNCFTRKDFELQFEGLHFFDQKMDIGLFQDEEFIAICEEIDAYYPELFEEQSKEIDEIFPIEGEESIVKEEPNADQFDLMNRKELVDWHRENKTNFLVKPNISDDEIRNVARNFLASGLNEETQETEVVDSEKISPQDRLAALRKNLKK